MDELLGVTCVMCGHGGYTGTLSVRYLSPTPLDIELSGKAWVKAINGRKAVIVGELRAEDRVCAEAEGLFTQTEGIVSSRLVQIIELVILEVAYAHGFKIWMDF